ncbi:ACP S-malonyltransferase [Marinicella rhabdoformis]|uniref:ACP S-malonyltransferase n=1 Tax=Marinicella rhabdoformis TaxID=2580566 RepID=UPI0012AEC590|nr:ACP S-malonyltransferase [Marinicella rhabdoformis]
MTKTAFVFPGQGSQSVGMLDALTEYSEITTLFEQANDVLGHDILTMVNTGPADDLNQTQWTQPALLAASVGIYQAISKRSEIQVDVMAGHSLGEYSALVCAGVMSFEQAINLVHLRGRYMQQAVPAGTGSMAAVLGLEPVDVETACAEAQKSVSGVVSAANYNSPGQIVIAGEKAAVEAASALCADKGAKKVMPLAVSVPSHCALMKPAAEQLSEDLQNIDWQEAKVDVIHNFDVSVHNDVAAIKKALMSQLYSPVRWTETMQKLQQMSVETVAECGPGKVLSGLFKRFDRSLTVFPLMNAKGIEKLLEGLGI